MKPKILIPLAHSNEPRESPRYFARVACASSIERAGGIPLFICRPKAEEILELGEFMDGLLLMGGVDPHPRLYNETVLPECGKIDEGRDVLELTLFRIAVEKRLPVLGLCRGLQIINIHFGGTLYQDVPSQFLSTIPHESHAILERKKLMHSVELIPNTILSKILRKSSMEVNSIHHQGVKVLGQGLRISAQSPDGLIEAIEHTELPFCIATQWHPEEFEDDISRDLFGHFITHAQPATRGTSI